MRLSAIVSDRVGASYDLVQEGKTGFVFPRGDVNALIESLQGSSVGSRAPSTNGRGCPPAMETWSPRQNVEAFVNAVERAVAFKRGQ